MIISSFGDSFFVGNDLADDISQYNEFAFSQLTWPALIADQLNCRYRCYASSGIGNQIILDRLLTCINKHGNNLLYIINWTWIDRFDYINAESTKWDTLRPSNTENIDKFYYKNIHSEEGDKLSNLTHIYTAINALESANCKFIMTYMDNLLFDKQWHVTPSIDYLQKQVHPHLRTFDSMTFLEWSRHNGFPESDNWHPLEQAHKSAADYWIKDFEMLLSS